MASAVTKDPVLLLAAIKTAAQVLKGTGSQLTIRLKEEGCALPRFGKLLTVVLRPHEWRAYWATSQYVEGKLGDVHVRIELPLRPASEAEIAREKRDAERQARAEQMPDREMLLDEEPISESLPARPDSRALPCKRQLALPAHSGGGDDR